MKNLLRNQFIYLWIIFLFIGNCKNNIYFGNHKFIVLEWSNNKIYDINISGQLSYIDPYNKSELAKGFNLFAIYVKTNYSNYKTESFIQDLIIRDNIVSLGELKNLSILELNENMCILKYELSESKTWIIKIFKEEENKTHIQEFVNDKLQEEYYLTAGFI
jgi:hypothetical protein